MVALVPLIDTTSWKASLTLVGVLLDDAMN
jgi:hypothetical protein